MDPITAASLLATPAVVLGLHRAHRRLQLSRAKHPSLRGHSRMARALARHLPFYEYDGERFFAADGAPLEVVERRRTGFEALAADLARQAPRSLALTREIESGLSDLEFTSTCRVPFQFRSRVRRDLGTAMVAVRTEGDTWLRDADDNRLLDLTGAYGLNVHGHDFYAECIDAARRVGDLGPVLGPYHPVVADNIERLRRLSGKEEVSFHMSGTEAVMQAVALARYHTGRSRLVRFCGAYHGWWDGVQPGPGNPRDVRDVYTLRDMDPRTLTVLRTRTDIACVLVNPLQALHPNANAPGDATLVDGTRAAGFDRAAYTAWLKQLAAVCRARGIVLLLDEIFVGFRLARGGAQEYFGIEADLVTYGKTVGGGLPIGVVCGPRRLMRRFRDDRPAHVCFARGTFNSHPYVMAAMNEFLRRTGEAPHRLDHAALDRRWNERAARVNALLEAAALPLRVAGLASIWTVTYPQPGRYHWMLQFYLRRAGLWLQWVGSGRLVFCHTLSDEDFDVFCERFLAAAEAMRADGWWWRDEAVDARTIRKQVTRELLAAWLGEPRPLLRGGGPSPRPSAWFHLPD